VLPNYGTVETANTLPPLTSGQKFRIATASVFDWAAYPFNGALAAIAQAKNDPKEWGQGWGAYGKRYGASFADNSIGTYMTVAVFPSLLHEDPRYYQLGRGSFLHRAYHGVNRLFVTRTDSGFTPVHVGAGMGPAFAYYHIAADGIWEITEPFGKPMADLKKLDAWQKQGRPPVYVDTLVDLKTSETPQWKDAETKKAVPSVGKLDARVTETGACSAEKFLDAFRNAGCVPRN
jgi:hypothetical protein